MLEAVLGAATMLVGIIVGFIIVYVSLGRKD